MILLRGPIMNFNNFIWSWAHEADTSGLEMHYATFGYASLWLMQRGAGRGKPAPTGRLGTTVGPNLLWASPIYRPANDLIHFLIRIIGI